MLRGKVAKFPFTAVHQAPTLARHSAEGDGTRMPTPRYDQGRGQRVQERGGSHPLGESGEAFFHLVRVNAVIEAHRVKELEGDSSNWMN